ncbi:DUF6612 family protein [Paenibacillus kobensis]|uniref:DUF6612 family protein n=1 Tax=Paenibacillus kobensis TaxID=59841 RepID=UPI000FD7CD25|nr:DUF6612 family protein [Paenibacillus kobensis]
MTAAEKRRIASRADIRGRHRISSFLRFLSAGRVWMASIGAAVVLLAGCSSGEPKGSTLQQQLEQSAEAASKPAAWTIEMKLAQQLEEGGKLTKLDMTTTGPIEREPLRMKQTIQTAFETENSKLETYLTPDGYYMHDLTTDDWMKMAEDVLPQVKETLSDYQIRPSEPVSRLAKASDKVQAEQKQDGHTEYIYSGDGKDEGARAIIDDVLRGTFGGGAMTKDVAASIQVEKFEYQLAVDSATQLPSEVHMTMAISIAFTPNVRSTLNETLDIKYSGWNETPTIEVPEAAKKAELVAPPAG